MRQSHLTPSASHIPIDTNALSFIEVSLSVARTDALGMTRLDETVEHICNHVELRMSLMGDVPRPWPHLVEVN